MASTARAIASQGSHALADRTAGAVAGAAGAGAGAAAIGAGAGVAAGAGAAAGAGRVAAAVAVAGSGRRAARVAAACAGARVTVRVAVLVRAVVRVARAGAAERAGLVALLVAAGGATAVGCTGAGAGVTTGAGGPWRVTGAWAAGGGVALWGVGGGAVGAWTSCASEGVRGSAAAAISSRAARLVGLGFCFIAGTSMIAGPFRTRRAGPTVPPARRTVSAPVPDRGAGSSAGSDAYPPGAFLAAKAGTSLMLVRFAPMPRFYFHVYNDIVAIDEEGLELPDLEAARAQALESARELVCEGIHKGQLNLDHRIEVEDEDHKPVLILTYRDAFAVSGERPTLSA
jgi:hypothetical protein